MAAVQNRDFKLRFVAARLGCREVRLLEWAPVQQGVRHVSDKPPPAGSFTTDAIQQRAYFLWEADGRPEGRSEHYWQLALAQLQAAATPETPAKAKPARKSAAKSPAKAAADKPAGKSASKTAKTLPAEKPKKATKKSDDKPAKKAATKPRASVSSKTK